jgi:aspartyl-tRNA(Asn)/glutamyl-tRNA(Gln) amidotransferase subunit A
MTWTVEDTASMLQAIAGPDPKDPTSSRAPVPDYSAALKEDIKGLTIGVPRHFFWADDPRIDRETLAVVDAALQTLAELGAQVEDVTIPTLHYAGAAQPAIMLSEAFAYHQRLLRSQPEEFGDMVRARFRIGGLLSSVDYVQAQRLRNVLKREFAAVLQKVDVIVSPTMSNPAPTFATFDGMTTASRPSFTGPYNLTGMPAISVPCGFTAAGLPLGCKSLGNLFDEPTVLRMAYAYQQYARWIREASSI